MVVHKRLRCFESIMRSLQVVFIRDMITIFLNIQNIIHIHVIIQGEAQETWVEKCEGLTMLRQLLVHHRRELDANFTQASIMFRYCFTSQSFPGSGTVADRTF